MLDHAAAPTASPQRHVTKSLPTVILDGWITRGRWMELVAVNQQAFCNLSSEGWLPEAFISPLLAMAARWIKCVYDASSFTLNGQFSVQRQQEKLLVLMERRGGGAVSTSPTGFSSDCNEHLVSIAVELVLLSCLLFLSFFFFLSWVKVSLDDHMFIQKLSRAFTSLCGEIVSFLHSHM